VGAMLGYAVRSIGDFYASRSLYTDLLAPLNDQSPAYQSEEARLAW